MMMTVRIVIALILLSNKNWCCFYFLHLVCYTVSVILYVQ